jgi:hypothetical protein
LIGTTSSGKMPRSRKFTIKTSAKTNTAYQARPRDGHGASAAGTAARSAGASLVAMWFAIRL